MFSNLSFVLTVLTYIAVIIFNLQSFSPRGEYQVGAGLIGFGILAVYAVCSLILTISVTTNGGFDWISSSKGSRNLGVGVLWLGMVLGVVFCTMIRMDYRADNQPTGFLYYLTLPLNSGAIWLPLLMLVPYAILLNPEWGTTFSPTFYKTPLIVACAIGYILYFLPSIIANYKNAKNYKVMSEPEYAFNNSMDKINNEQSITGLLTFINEGIDERLQNAAADKIKQHKDLEGGLIKALDENSFMDCDKLVFYFLERNNIEHPERLIASINNAIARIASKIQNIMIDPDINENYLKYEDVEPLCRVLDRHFKNSSKVFRPNMLKLQEVLAITPAKRTTGDSQKLEETLNKYRLAVKNWLDTH